MNTLPPIPGTLRLLVIAERAQEARVELTSLTWNRKLGISASVVGIPEELLTALGIEEIDRATGGGTIDHPTSMLVVHDWRGVELTVHGDSALIPREN